MGSYICIKTAFAISDLHAMSCNIFAASIDDTGVDSLEAREDHPTPLEELTSPSSFRQFCH